MSEVESKDKLPKDNYHIYHATSRRNLHDILVSGIKQSPSVGKWRRVNKFLDMVREENSFSVGPQNRSKSVFCFSRYADVANTDDENLVFAVDTREVDQPMYRASYHTVTKVHEIVSTKSSMSVEDVLKSRVVDADSKEAYNLAEEYWENMENVNPPINRGGEILIDGDVRSSAVTCYSK